MNGSRLATANHRERGRYGTVDWLFREYKSSDAYLDKVSRGRGRTTSGPCCWSLTS